ncbi:MAG: asparagine synthetase B family protein, partial [Candidatus Thorarchaeota archaeon]
MCGILALYFKSDLGPEKLRVDFEMLVDSMKHRGPDGKGIFKESNVLMGNRRLAIIDLTKEAGQPMRSADGRFVLIFNGEIYNYRELGGAPEFEGVSFRTQSDTEILLESFVKMGPNALHRFNGMFAFAIWDRKEQSLFVARDRFGIKPLYYYENETLIAFSSEIKAILPLVEKLEPNDEIVYDFLAFGRVDHLDKTFFRGIHRFPAGCYGIVGRSGLRIIRWYDISQEVLKIKAEKEFRNRDTISHV